VDPMLVRRAWHAGEVVHDLAYFAPECVEVTEALGLHGFWAGYFGCRAAPLGPVPAAVVTATFYGFAPEMVGRAIPEVWSLASPERLLTARLDGVAAAMGRVFGAVDDRRMMRAAELSGIAAAAVDRAGRPLAAANSALPVPVLPRLALWQNLTTLREHRGDGHIALLVAGRIDPVASHVLAAAAGRAPGSWLRLARRWDDAAWHAGQDRLRERGWLDGEGTITTAGTAARDQLEADTDVLAAGPYDALGEDGTRELVDLLEPLARRVLDSGSVLVPNPVGVPGPDGAPRTPPPA